MFFSQHIICCAALQALNEQLSRPGATREQQTEHAVAVVSDLDSSAAAEQAARAQQKQAQEAQAKVRHGHTGSLGSTAAVQRHGPR